MSYAPAYLLPTGLRVGPTPHLAYARPAGSCFTIPAGQAATPQNINAVIEQYDSALKTQKLFTNIALGLTAIAGAVAIYKHVTCADKISDAELETHRAYTRAPVVPAPYAPRYELPEPSGRYHDAYEPVAPRRFRR